MYVCGGRGDGVRLMGGLFVLAGVLLSFASRWFLLLAVLPAVMGILSFFTGFCPSEMVMQRLGVPKRDLVPLFPAPPKPKP